MVERNHTFGALGGGLSAAIASAVTRSPPEMVFNISRALARNVGLKRGNGATYTPHGAAMDRPP